MTSSVRALLLVVCCISSCTAQDNSNTVQRIMQRMVERLHRHELRTNQVGEQTLQVLARLEQNQAAQESSITNLGNTLMRIEARVTNIENSMQQTTDAERVRDNNLQENMITILEKFENIMSVEQGNKVLRRFNKKMNELSNEINTHMMEAEIKMSSLNTNISDGLSHLIEQMVQKESDNAVKLQQMVLQLNNLARALEAVDSRQLVSSFQETMNQLIQGNTPNIGAVMPQQLLETLPSFMTRLIEIETVLNEMNVKLKTLSYQAQVYNNETQEKLESVRAQSNQGIAEKLDQLISTQLLVKNRLADATGFTETIWQEVNGVLSELVDKMAGIGKLEKVVLDSADLGLDTKRLLEYGVQQILLEVEDMIKVRTTSIKDTIEAELKDFSRSILTNQTISLYNMTDELDGEISRVWRQINFMYSTLSDSQSVLQTVENQTKVYVNDSLTKVQSMDGQVGQVLTRMVDVEENLNYLLKHLSHIVADFNKMKGVIGTQFENIRTQFASVYSKLAGNETVVDDGPDQKGPIPIEANEEISNDLLQD